MNDIVKNLESKENITNNDWRTVEQEIKYLYEMIKSIEVGATSFESITGLPEDNVALKAVLDGKASEVDLQTLEGLVETLQTAVSNVYTKTETDTLLDDKADKTDTYTKTEVDTLLDDKADQTDLDTLNDTVSDIQEDLADKVDKETGKSLMEDTLPGEVADNRIDIEELKLKVQDIQIIQVRIMPTPSVDYLGKIVQYIGPTVEAYTNGYFYQCDYDTDLADYTWIEKYTQPVGEVDLSNYYTKTETNNLLQSKQDTLTAGDGIKIQGTVIMQDILDDTISSAKTTWTSRYLESLFHSLSGLSAVEIVDERPLVPVNNTMYYVKDYEEGEEPLYQIWFYQNNTWTNFGTTAIDLTNYYNKSEVDALLANKQNTLTEGTGIRISNNNVEVKIDGTTIKVNSAGNLYVEGGGGGGGGKTYYDGQGITVDNTNNIINANVDDTSIKVNNQSKLEVKEVGADKVLVDGTDPLNKVMLDTKLSDIDTDITDRYTKTEVDEITDLLGQDISDLQDDKADKATTLTGYGITDAYTKTETDALLDLKAPLKSSQASTSNNNCIFNFSKPENPATTKIIEKRIFNTNITDPITGSASYGSIETTQVWTSTIVQVYQIFYNATHTQVFHRTGTYNGELNPLTGIESATFTWSNWLPDEYPEQTLALNSTYITAGNLRYTISGGNMVVVFDGITVNTTTGALTITTNYPSWISNAFKPTISPMTSLHSNTVNTSCLAVCHKTGITLYSPAVGTKYWGSITVPLL